MTQDDKILGAVLPFDFAPAELAYPGLSPQLLARIKQLWSANGLDFDQFWRIGIRSLPGFRAINRTDNAPDSASVDGVFLFDQALLWVRALSQVTQGGPQAMHKDFTPAQWHGWASLSARLCDQLTALRLLALTNLPMPAMQIARSLSEDVDMLLVLLIRPKLAARFAACTTVEDASDFWRRHIAGGRAFRSVSEKLYTVGIDYSADTEYAKWRKDVLATLGTAVHSNALGFRSPIKPSGNALLTDDSLQFATFRIHELCAYSLLLRPSLPEMFETEARSLNEGSAPSTSLSRLAGPVAWILLNQMNSLNSALSGEMN